MVSEEQSLWNISREHEWRLALKTWILNRPQVEQSTICVIPKHICMLIQYTNVLPARFWFLLSHSALFAGKIYRFPIT